jgi:hypothetical protein
MFEQNPEIGQGVEAAFQAAEGLTRGDVLTHERIEQAFGIRRYTSWWTRGIQLLRRRMQDERGIWLASDTTVGYRLAPHRVQIAEGPRRTKRAARQIERGLRSVRALPDGELSHADQKAKFGVEERLAAIARDTRQDLRLQQFLLRPKPTSGRSELAEGQAQAV